MSTNQTLGQLVAELDGDIKYHEAHTKQSAVLQWVATMLVTIAGVVTAAAGAPESIGQSPWFQSPIILVISGLITATGAVVNKLGDPSGTAERHRKLSLVIWAIRGAVLFQKLPVSKAQQLRTKAQSDPEEVIKELTQLGSEVNPG